MLRLSKYERGALQKLVPQNHARRMHHPTPGHVPRDVPVKEKTNGAVEVRGGNLPDLRVERVPAVLRRVQLVGEEDRPGHGAHARPTPSCVPSPPPVSPGLRCRSDPGPTPLPRGRAGISASGLPGLRSLYRNPRPGRPTPRGVWPEQDRGAEPLCAPSGRRGRVSRPARPQFPRPSGCAQTGSWKAARRRA